MESILELFKLLVHYNPYYGILNGSWGSNYWANLETTKTEKLKLVTVEKIWGIRVLFLSRSQVEKLITMREAIDAVEEAFRAKGLGKVQMPPKSYVFLQRYQGDFRVMPAYLENIDVAGVKIVNVHPQNPGRYGLPTVMAVIVLLDPKTGAPIAVMDGTAVTNIRTGAAGAIAAKHLARKDSTVVAMVGSGTQARTQLLALAEIFDIEEVRVNDISRSNAKAYVRSMKRKVKSDYRISNSTEEAVKDADIVVTTTPSRRPIVMNEWISDGTHINAIGADAPGKQELDPQILVRAKVVVDDIQQAIHSGEVNVPLSLGLIARADIYGDLGEIIAGKKPGRISEDEVTVFDSTGLAVQDIATDWVIFQKAKRLGKGRKIELLG